MSSIRKLKKDIDFLTNEIINDAFLASSIHGGKIENELNIIFEEVINFRNELFKKINAAPSGRKKEGTKKYFNTLKSEMDNRFKEFFDKLSDIIANNQS